MSGRIECNASNRSTYYFIGGGDIDRNKIGKRFK
ncbi:MAG: hypothetical protein JXR07_20510 [Reichenbachiella sp.]